MRLDAGCRPAADAAERGRRAPKLGRECIAESDKPVGRLRGGLRPAGYRSAIPAPVPPFAPSELGTVPADALPALVAQRASERAGAPVGLYLIDLEGRWLVRLAGDPALPQRLPAGQLLGPELPAELLPGLVRRLAAELPEATMTPLWVRGRATGVLLCAGPAARPLDDLARVAGVELELASGASDLLERTRRVEPISPAAEVQQNLLPPRIARTNGAELAAMVLPAYDVGGDWFDHAANPEGLWLAVADGVGKGPVATALAALALGALRAARRNGGGLDDAAMAMHHVLHDHSQQSDFVTAVLARLDPLTGVLEWLTCGHPPPLVVAPDGTVEELTGALHPPLGLFGRERELHHQRRLVALGERLVLYSDGVSERRRADGTLLGREGIAQAVAASDGPSAAAAVIGVIGAVRDASDQGLRDDATLLVVRRVAPAQT